MSKLFRRFFPSLVLAGLLVASMVPTVPADEGWFVPGLPDLTPVIGPWQGTVAFGLNGTSGNSENVDLNLNVDATRELPSGSLELLVSYFYAENAFVTTTDRVFSKARHERNLANPDFTWYCSGTAEWDRFTGYDFRLALHTGVGILFYEDELCSFKGRTGLGASREYGGVQDDWIPELELGLDWHRHLSDRTRLFANSDFYPNVQDFRQYRVNTRAGFDTLLDARLGISLQTFVLNRYNSAPDPGFQANDLDYGLSLAFDF